MNPGIFVILLVLVSAGSSVVEGRTVRLTNSSPSFANNNEQQLGRPTAEMKGQNDRASSPYSRGSLDGSKLFDGLTLATYGYD